MRCKCVRDVIAVQIERSNDVVLGRAQQDLLQKCISNYVLDHNSARQLHPRTAIEQFGIEFALCEFVSPITESPFGEFHDVAFVNQGYRLTLVGDRVLNGLAYQTLGTLLRYRLDAYSGRLREPNLFDTHFPGQKIDYLARFRGFCLPFDAGIDVFRVLPEYHHVRLFRLLQRAGHAFKISDRSQTYEQVKLLAQGDVDRPDTAANRGRQRSLNGYHEFFCSLEGLIG